MLSFLKRHHRIIIACAAFALCAAAAVSFIRVSANNISGTNQQSGVSAKKSGQSDYPVLPEPALCDRDRPVTLKEMVNKAALIVDATVTGVQKEQFKTFYTQKGSADEKLYGSSYSATMRPVSLKINKTLKGKSQSDSITMDIVPLALDCSPAFKPGDRLVFLLSRYIGGDYAAVELQEGYFYIAGDGKIYPAAPSGELVNISDQSYDSFTKSIQKSVPSQ